MFLWFGIDYNVQHMKKNAKITKLNLWFIFDNLLSLIFFQCGVCLSWNHSQLGDLIVSEKR
jgi:hypothetical protein